MKHRLLLLLLFLATPLMGVAQTDSGSGGSGGLQTSGLAAVDASAIGMLTSQNGGFPADFWQKIPPEVAIQTIQSLPNDYRQRQLLLLARKLLLTAAPIDKDGQQQQDDNLEGNYSHDFIASRIEKLYQMGLYSDAYNLLQLVPGDYFSSKIERLSINLQLQLGNYLEACATLSNRELPSTADNFWQKLLFLCDVLDGRNTQAEFILNIMTEVQGFTPAFTELANQSLGLAPADTLSAGDNDAISAALYDHKAPPAFANDGGYNAGQLWRLMRSPAVSDADRILIAGRLYGKALIPADKLPDYYAKVPFYKSRANASDYTEADYSHAFQQLAVSENESEKAKIITRLITAAIGAEQLPSMLAQLSGYDFITPDNSLQKHAPLLAIAELYKDDIANASSWAKIAKGDKQDRPILYDLLAVLNYPNVYASDTLLLDDILDADTLQAVPLKTIIAANEIVKRHDKSLLSLKSWENLKARPDVQITNLSYTDAINANYIASLKGNSPAALFIAEFLKSADDLVETHPTGYLQLWQMTDLQGQARKALLDYFISNGFVIGR